MPTKTFFHLPKEKQQRLLDAAKTEFSRASLREASIANIVKLAEIPRGSFYQYFEDKEDLYFYYFDNLRRDSKRDLEKEIDAAEGDLVEGFDRYFTKMISEILKGPNAAFYKNLFMNMDYRASDRVTPSFSKEKYLKHHSHSRTKEEMGQKLFESIDHQKLKIKDTRELGLVMQFMMSIVISTITNAYKHSGEDPTYDTTQAIADFQLKIEWLKYGIYKQKEGE